MTNNCELEVSQIKKSDFNKALLKLDIDTKVLTRIRKIRKELLSNGAYSHKNMEEQDIKLNRVNAPDWEKEIIRRSWEFTRDTSKRLFKQLDELLMAMGY